MSWRALGLALLLAPRSLLADTPYVDAQLRTRPSSVEVFQETVNPTPRYLGRSDRFALPAAGSQIRLLLKAPGYADTRLVLSPGYFVNHTTYPERGEVQLPPRTWQAVGQSWWRQLLGLLAGLTGIGAWRRLRVRRQRAGTTAMVGGRQLGELIHRGQGGTEVYRSLDGQLAIKIHPGRPLPPETRHLFSLSHPNLVHLVDYGESARGGYLVLEWMDTSLRARLQAGPLAPAEVRQVVLQLAQALGYLHGRGLVHADLKPENVLLRGSRVCLTDLDSSVAIASPPCVLGTPGYLSPEQWLKQPLAPATDQHALALLTCELLTGQRPKDLSQTGQWSEPPSLPPGLPAKTEAVLRRMLEPDWRRRYAQVQEAAEELCATLV